MHPHKYPGALLFSGLLLAISFGPPAQAADNVSLDRLPQAATEEAVKLAALFNFTKNGCLPSPAISYAGVQNGGLKTTGDQTGGCQRASQLDFSTDKGGSNTYYRKQCLTDGTLEYCAHMYALYFMKDQPMSGSGGHKNDWEWAMLWTAGEAGSGKSAITYGAHSYHKEARTQQVSGMSFGQDSHARFVYDQTGKTTHTMYFYPRNTGDFVVKNAVTPPIVDWYLMKSPMVSNETLRNMFNTYDYGDANCSFNDNNFAVNIVSAVPPGSGYSKDVARWKAAMAASSASASQGK